MSRHTRQAKEGVTFVPEFPLIGNSPMNHKTSIQWNMTLALRNVKGQVTEE